MSLLPFLAWDDFDTYTIGTNVAGHTLRGGGAPTYKPQYSTTAILPYKRRYLEFLTDATTDYHAVSVDAVDSDANRATFDIVFGFAMSLTTVEEIHVYARGAGTATMTDFVRVRIKPSINEFYVDTMVASAYTGGTGTSRASFTFTAGHAYLCRFRGSGGAISVKMWDASLGMAGEPAAFNLTPTGLTPTAAGWIGIGGRHTTLTAKVSPPNFLAIATNGDVAVCPRTNAERTAWLAKQDQLRIVVAKMRATGYDSSGSPYTKVVKAYIANHGYTSAAQDSPALQHFDACITGVPAISREMPAALSGQAQVSIGRMRVANPAQAPGMTSAGYAIELDGVNDTLTATSSTSLNFGSDSFTIEGWFWHDDYTYPKSNMVVHKRGVTWNTTAGWGIGAGYNANNLYVFAHDGATLYGANIALDTGCKPADVLARWSHMAVVFDRASATVRVYINGVLQSGSLSIAGMGSVSNAQNFTVGECVGWYLDGKVKELRAWNIARNAGQIADYMNKRARGDESGLAACWHCDEGTGTTTADAVNANTLTLTLGPTWATGKGLQSAVVDIFGTRDDWLRTHWLRDGFELILLGQGWPLHDGVHLIRGRLGNPIATDLKTLEFPLADMSEALNVPLTTQKFSSGDLNGLYKPVLIGLFDTAAVGQFEPPETSSQVFQISDTALQSTANAVGNVLDNQVQLTGTTGLTHTSADTGTEIITLSAAHGAGVDSRLVYTAGTPPAPLNVGTTYWVKTVPGSTTVTLAATRGGATINLTTAGTAGSPLTIYNYWFDEAAATMTLIFARTPGGRITVCEVSDDGNTSQIHTAYTNILTRAGLNANYVGPGFTAAAFDAGNPALWFDSNPHTCAEAMARLAKGSLSWYGFAADGPLGGGSVTVPAATAVISLDRSDIADVRHESTRRATDFSVAQRSCGAWYLTGGPLNVGTIWARQQKIVIAQVAATTGVPIDDHAQVTDADKASEFSYDALTNAPVATSYDLYRYNLGIFSVTTTKLTPLECTVGDTVSIDFPRLGFKQWNSGDPASPDNTATIDSRLAVVVGHYLKPNKAGNSYSHVDLKVYRRIPGYYPTSNLN